MCVPSLPFTSLGVLLGVLLKGKENIITLLGEEEEEYFPPRVLKGETCVSLTSLHFPRRPTRRPTQGNKKILLLFWGRKKKSIFPSRVLGGRRVCPSLPFTSLGVLLGVLLRGKKI